jgi:broad specificity phosphatase PhoE
MVVALAAPSPAEAQKAVYLVRHAEKAGDDLESPLTTAGAERAQALAQLLEKSGIKAIYTSEFRRTKETAAPLAAKLGITTISKPAANPDAVLADISANHAGDIVLIVGHSTSVPALLKKWDPTADVQIGECEFDNIFVLVPTGSSSAGWTRFRYTGRTVP